MLGYHHSHFHTCSCSSWNQLPSLHLRCLPCIPQSEYHNQCVITFILYKMISKRRGKAFMTWKQKYGKMHSCIPTFLMLGFYLVWILSGFRSSTLRPILSPKAWVCPDEVLSLTWGLTPSWLALDILQVYFMVSCYAHLNIDESLALMGCGHSTDPHSVVCWLVSLLSMLSLMHHSKATRQNLLV